MSQTTTQTQQPQVERPEVLTREWVVAEPVVIPASAPPVTSKRGKLIPQAEPVIEPGPEPR